jgi:hypothetical protein
MAETPNGRIALEHTTDSTSPSTAKMKSAIRETRVRLARRLTRTGVYMLLTAPSAAHADADDGLIGHAATAIAVAGRAKRAWSDARRTGLLRRAAIAAVTVTIAAALAAKTRRR